MATTRRHFLGAAGMLLPAALVRALSQKEKALEVTYYYLPG